MNMENAPARKANIADSVALTICSYRGDAPYVRQILSEAGLDEFVRADYADLSKGDSVQADIVLPYFDVSDDIERYVADVTALKNAPRQPAVIAVIDEQARNLATAHLGELPTDDILFAPTSVEEFARIVMTHVVSIKVRSGSHTRGVSGKTHQSFGEILTRHRIISRLQLHKALDYQTKTGDRLGDVLVNLGYISEDQKIHFLAGQLGVEIATLKQYASADLNVVALIPQAIAEQINCIALEKRDSLLVVAMEDVLNLEHLDTIRDITDLSIKAILGNSDDIRTSRERYYRDIASQRDASSLVADLNDDLEYVKKEVDDISAEEAAAAGAERGIVKIVNMLIANAVRENASDIHIEPMEHELIVRNRVDGSLRKVFSPPKASHQAIITRIKILADLDIAERRLPQDGRMVVRMGNREIDIRVSILPSVFGEKAVLRILDKEAFEKSVSNLGFANRDLEAFRRNIVKPYGMIIVTGPTGSGKSTTLYSAIQTIKSVTKNIVTVEDPVEFHIDGVVQVNVLRKIGLTFSNALRSILRQDPDVVLIGEIRDGETADIAVKMSMTGHLVFSTLHTNDAAASIARLIDIGVPPLLLASSLNLIVAQRLVKRICPKCKVEYTPSDELLEQLRLDDSNLVFFRGEGCVSCNGTGYAGRTGIFELMEISREIRTMILRNAPSHEIQTAAENAGMRTLRKAGLEFALKGITTVEQVIAVTTEL
jgi:type IV pilus assembly protein PilB